MRADPAASLRLPLMAGMLSALAVIGGIALLPAGFRQGIEAQAEDALMRLATPLAPPSPAAPEIVVIDIDAATLRLQGPWPWPREKLAQLVERLEAAKPRAVALDMLLAGPDPRSPQAEMARRGVRLPPSLMASLNEALPDGDVRLARSLEGVPTVLGLVLSPEPSNASLPPPHILSRGGAALVPHWQGAGVQGPHPPFARGAAGLGVIALPGDADGVIRRVPLFVSAGGVAYPGVALELLRVAQDASAYLIENGRLNVGEHSLPLPEGALLRLVPGGVRPRVISAADLLADGPLPLGPDALVLIGGSAPELGGLRNALDDALEPAVLVQARALAQMLRPLLPQAPRQSGLIHGALMVGLPLLAILAAALATPLIGFVAVLCGLAGTAAASAALFVSAQILFVPLASGLSALAGYAGAALAGFIASRRRESRLRTRFSQHLAPQVVAKILAAPELVKLSGEKRDITALFTDVEDFTAMTERADPAALVSLLDAYFEGLAEITLRHGGMIDKFVGDALHAFFNAPLDLPDHPEKALACAQEIALWAAAFRLRPEAARLGFGRTRIGLESGPAVVGEVGLRAKLDYTAHGPAVNAAARLEAANKHFGSTLCLGPGIAARLPQAALRPLGTLALRGFAHPVAVFDLWPSGVDEAWKTAYLDALPLSPAASVPVFAALAAQAPLDGVSALRARHQHLASARKTRMSDGWQDQRPL